MDADWRRYLFSPVLTFKVAGGEEILELPRSMLTTKFALSTYPALRYWWIGESGGSG
jgi:hypothetical protein